MAFLPTLVVGLLVTVTVGASVTVVFGHSSQHDGESDPMIDEETKMQNQVWLIRVITMSTFMLAAGEYYIA